MKSTVLEHQHDETRWVLELRGPLTGRSENPLLDAYGAASRGGARWLGLDFSQVERMDGNGLSLVVRLLSWAGRAGQRAAAMGLTPRCRRLFRELGLDAAMSLFSDTAQALGKTPGPALGERSEICPESEWALGLGRAKAEDLGRGPLHLNVVGRAVTTPLEGFGELWHKVYRLRLAGSDTRPAEVTDYCREHLGSLWPEGNELRLAGEDFAPGAVAHLLLRLPGGMPLSTGIRVLHVGRTAFTFATLEGHMEAGWITFSAFQEAGTAVMQVESLARTGDPMYEVGFKLFGHSQQEGFWKQTLTRLAAHYGVPPRIQVNRTCLDRSHQWARLGNLRRNAAVGTGVAVAASLLSKAFSGRGRR